MIAEQLQAARAAHWRQNQNPILTLEDALSWIEQHPLSLFLPRKVQLPAPAPSFVEAVLGESNSTPPPAAIEQARELLIRLIDSGHVVALNLFGALGEQPDFVAQTEILPFAVSFRGERDWKQPPGKAGGQKVSPLVLDLWKVLEKEGPLTASAARELLGRELTEAAVMRALSELWQTLRVLPALQAGGQPALWALTQHHHRAALTKGSSTSQVTAISLLVSMYLQSVYAATNEEIEIFLSPLVSRSRIREAVRGLAATRQIQSLSMDAQTYYFLEGGLPEFAAELEPERVEPVRRRRPGISAPPESFQPTGAAAPVPHWIPAANTASDPIQHAAASPAAEGRTARPRPYGTENRRPARTKDVRPPRAEKPRWQSKDGAPGRARPSFGARPGGASRNASSSGERQRTRTGLPTSRTSDRAPGRAPFRTEGRTFNRTSNRAANRAGGARPDGRPAGDWKRKPAAPGPESGPPAAKWRKFPQPGEKTPAQRPGTGDRPASGYSSNRPARPQGGPPERREGGSPWKKPRWDRKRTTGAAIKPQREGAPRAGSRASSGGERSPGGAPRFARPDSRQGSRPASRPGSRPGPRPSRPQGAAPSDTASRPPYRRNDRDDRGGKPSQGFSPPKRRSRAPDTRPSDEGRAAAPGFSKPAPRSFAKSGPRAGGPSRPPGRQPDRTGDRTGDRAGGGGGGRTGGYKSAGYRAGSPKKDGPKKENRGTGGFKPRGFDSSSRPGRPKSSKFAGSPKSSFRDRNLGKKKPEA